MSATGGAVAPLSITSDKLAADSVTLSKIATTSTGSNGQILQRTATAMDWVTPAAASVANLSITTAKLANKAVTGAKIADTTIGAMQLAAGAVETAKINDDAVIRSKIGPGAVGSTELGTDAVKLTHIDTTTAGSSGQILQRTATAMDWVSPSSASVGTGSITSDKIASDAVTGPKIADDAITPAHLNTVSAGTDGQVLTRTATSWDWMTAASGGGATVTSITWTPTVTLSGTGLTQTTASHRFAAYRIGKFVFWTASVVLSLSTTTANITRVHLTMPYLTAASLDPFFTTVNNGIGNHYTVFVIFTFPSSIRLQFKSRTTFTNRRVLVSGAYVAS